MMGVLHAWKVIGATLGNQKGWNRRKMPAKFSGPETLTHWAVALPLPITLSYTEPVFLSSFILFTSIALFLVAFFTAQNLSGKTQRPLPGPWGLMAESVIGKELPHRALLPSPGSAASGWEADQGSIPGQWRAAQICRAALGATPRWFTCSASPLPLACIFCSTEPTLMALVLNCFEQWGLKFIGVKKHVWLYIISVGISRSNWESDYPWFSVKKKANFKTVVGWQYFSWNK